MGLPRLAAGGPGARAPARARRCALARGRARRPALRPVRPGAVGRPSGRGGAGRPVSAELSAAPFDVCGPLPEPGATLLEASAGTGKTFAIAALATRLVADGAPLSQDRKSTRLNSSHLGTSYAVFCLKK